MVSKFSVFAKFSLKSARLRIHCQQCHNVCWQTKGLLTELEYLQTLFLRQFLIEGYHQNSQLFSQNFIYDVDHFNEMLPLFTLVQFAEILGGYLAGSLAIMSDAAHLLSDCISFIVALLAIVWAKKSPNNHMTFGYKRIGMLQYIFEKRQLYCTTIPPTTIFNVVFLFLFENLQKF